MSILIQNHLHRSHYSSKLSKPLPNPRKFIIESIQLSQFKPTETALLPIFSLSTSIPTHSDADTCPLYYKLDTCQHLRGWRGKRWGAKSVPKPTPTLLCDNTLPIPKDENILSKDENILSTWSHRAWVAVGCITLLISLAKAVAGSTHSLIWVGSILAGLLGYLMADLVSGLYHWGIDNYGSFSTPIFGGQIEAFKGHHRKPWIITKRQFANNLHLPARFMTFLVLPLNLAFDEPIFHGFVAIFFGCTLFAQQFHAWAHETKSRLPPVVAALQDFGILISRPQHSMHHMQPFNNRYCIVSGIWNEFLDKHKVYEAMEMILFSKLGLRPRSWSEPTSEWTEEVEAEATEHMMNCVVNAAND